MVGKIDVITFGCRLNSYEGEVIKKILHENNININNKNIVIFNSCAVTKEAERQLRQSIRKVRSEQPEVVIGVVGCAVQVNKDTYINMPEVDFVLGNNSKLEVGSYTNVKKQNIIIDDVSKLNKLSKHFISGFENRARAFVQIQNGCDNKCTFCVTRLARGHSISTPSGQIIEQIKKLTDNGHREIVLVGIDIGDYGKRLDENLNLGKLIKKILRETKLERLRVSSMDIANLDDDLNEALKHEKRLMPHIHLSLQSGDNMILKRMLRRHTREMVLERCHDIIGKRPDTVIGADLIAGFPTETEEMHKNSLKIIEELPITYGHIFPYSERPETKAALMPQVDKNTRKLRAKELRNAATKNLNLLKEKINGTKQKVLVEGNGMGRLENYLQIEIGNDFNGNVGEIIEMVVNIE
ncbi:MAG: tRNA (N(6)-L-threonylcarbamoyladenosine(37)-C(2))-methylthiotransferase MtaB [Rickettsiales bacterium]|nr:tRNA (N(6)-L-threonylcarbamoyladenosine(37)-C(2))-methylthiotransferase MtaB [Rickettsiales bacterium]